ncbi:MAG: hypothetical protein ABSG02_20685 [Terriglobales bacterium]
MQSKNLKDAKANAHVADNNLKNSELRSEIVARVTQTPGGVKLSPFSQNKMGRAIGRWYCPHVPPQTCGPAPTAKAREIVFVRANPGLENTNPLIERHRHGDIDTTACGVLGSSISAALAYLAITGQITGGGSTDFRKKRRCEPLAGSHTQLETKQHKRG